jgi:hypothetical protein
MTIGESQKEKLTQLVQTDADAMQLFTSLVKLANASLYAAAQPVVRIETAGKLSSDPSKLASRAALEDMRRLHTLGYAYLVTSNVAYSSAARRIILAWAQTNQPSGSPIDETKLEPLFVAYDLTRREFLAREQETVERWLRLIVRRELEGIQPRSVTASNNWNSHRLKIVGLIGFVLDDRTLLNQASRSFRKQGADNLRPDGSSLDFHERDALHYHCYNLEPLLAFAVAAHREGLDLYHYTAPNGASLSKSVHFLLPYCEGTATHSEWVNTQVAFDRKRAEAGERKFETGKKFDPRDAVPVLELAEFFDRSLTPLLGKLTDHPGTSFPTWQCVLNEAQRP